jgi:hypothetical protein
MFSFSASLVLVHNGQIMLAPYNMYFGDHDDTEWELCNLYHAPMKIHSNIENIVKSSLKEKPKWNTVFSAFHIPPETVGIDTSKIRDLETHKINISKCLMTSVHFIGAFDGRFMHPLYVQNPAFEYNNIDFPDDQKILSQKLTFGYAVNAIVVFAGLDVIRFHPNIGVTFEQVLRCPFMLQPINMQPFRQAAQRF